MGRFLKRAEARRKDKNIDINPGSTTSVAETAHDSAVSMLEALTIDSAGSFASGGNKKTSHGGLGGAFRYHVPGSGSNAPYLRVDKVSTTARNNIGSTLEMEPKLPRRYIECPYSDAAEYNQRLYSYMLQAIDNAHSSQRNIVQAARRKIEATSQYASETNIRILYAAVDQFLSEIEIPEPVMQTGFVTKVASFNGFTGVNGQGAQTQENNDLSLKSLQENLMPKWVFGVGAHRAARNLELFAAVKEAISTHLNLFAELKTIRDALYVPYNILVFYRYALGQVCGSGTLIGDLNSYIDPYFQVFIQEQIQDEIREMESSSNGASLIATGNSFDMTADSFVYLYTKTQQFILGNEYGLAQVNQFEDVNEYMYNPEKPGDSKLVNGKKDISSRTVPIKLFLTKPILNDSLYRTPRLLGRCMASIYDSELLFSKAKKTAIPYGKKSSSSLDRAFMGSVELCFMPDQLLIVKDSRLYYPPLAQSETRIQYFKLPTSDQSYRHLLQIVYRGQLIILHQTSDQGGLEHGNDGSLRKLMTMWKPTDKSAFPKSYGSLDFLKNAVPLSTSNISAAGYYSEQIVFNTRLDGYIRGTTPLKMNELMKIGSISSIQHNSLANNAGILEKVFFPENEFISEVCVPYETASSGERKRLSKSKVGITINSNPVFSIFLDGTSRELSTRRIDASMPIDERSSRNMISIFVPGYMLALGNVDSKSRVLSALKWAKMLASSSNWLRYNNLLYDINMADFKADLIQGESTYLRDITSNAFLDEIKSVFFTLKEQHDETPCPTEEQFLSMVPNMRVSFNERTISVVPFKYEHSIILRNGFVNQGTYNEEAYMSDDSPREESLSNDLHINNPGMNAFTLGPVEGEYVKMKIEIFLEENPDICIQKDLDWINVRTISSDRRHVLSAPLDHIVSFNSKSLNNMTLNEVAFAKDTNSRPCIYQFYGIPSKVDESRYD